jgi:predicted nucleotidyltransferase
VSRQTEALPHLVARCVEAHPDCGIRLQGSVARGAERADSDIDLTVVVPGNALVRESDLLSQNNHWRMQLVQDQTSGLRLDINWVGVDELLDLIAERGAVAWFMFFSGTTLRDPSGVVARCETAVATWFQSHPEILTVWNRQQKAVDAFKSDRSIGLEFATQPAFLAEAPSEFINLATMTSPSNSMSESHMCSAASGPSSGSQQRHHRFRSLHLHRRKRANLEALAELVGPRL